MRPDITTEDLFAVNQLINDYWLRTDRVIDAPAAALYVEDGEMQIARLAKKGRAEIATYYAERRAEEDRSGRRTRHISSNLFVESADGKRIVVRFLVTVFSGRVPLPFAASAPSSMGDFRAVCRLDVDGQWRFEALQADAVLAGPDAPETVRG